MVSGTPRSKGLRGTGALPWSAPVHRSSLTAVPYASTSDPPSAIVEVSNRRSTTASAPIAAASSRTVRPRPTPARRDPISDVGPRPNRSLAATPTTECDRRRPESHPARRADCPRRVVRDARHGDVESGPAIPVCQCDPGTRGASGGRYRGRRPHRHRRSATTTDRGATPRPVGPVRSYRTGRRLERLLGAPYVADGFGKRSAAPGALSDVALPDDRVRCVAGGRRRNTPGARR